MSEKKSEPIQKVNEHVGHRQRLKKRAMLEGLDHFEDHVLLELLLFYTIPRADTNEIAHRLLNCFGSIAGVFNAPVACLQQVEGVGLESALFLHLMPQICRRYINCQVENEVNIGDPNAISAYMTSIYLGRENELVYLLCADKNKRMKKCVCISEGDGEHAHVDVARIIQEVTAVNASNVLIIHNHPNGAAMASPKDIAMTQAISAALKPLRVNLLDHMIFTGNTFLSMNAIPIMAQWFS